MRAFYTIFALLVANPSSAAVIRNELNPIDYYDFAKNLPFDNSFVGAFIANSADGKLLTLCSGSLINGYSFITAQHCGTTASGRSLFKDGLPRIDGMEVRFGNSVGAPDYAYPVIRQHDRSRSGAYRDTMILNIYDPSTLDGQINDVSSVKLAPHGFGMEAGGSDSDDDNHINADATYLAIGFGDIVYSYSNTNFSTNGKREGVVGNGFKSAWLMNWDGTEYINPNLPFPLELSPGVIKMGTQYCAGDDCEDVAAVLPGAVFSKGWMGGQIWSGDSGAPLLALIGGELRLVGIASQSFGGPGTGFPLQDERYAHNLKAANIQWRTLRDDLDGVDRDAVMFDDNSFTFFGDGTWSKTDILPNANSRGLRFRRCRTGPPEIYEEGGGCGDVGGGQSLFVDVSTSLSWIAENLFHDAATPFLDFAAKMLAESREVGPPNAIRLRDDNSTMSGLVSRSCDLIPISLTYSATDPVVLAALNDGTLIGSTDLAAGLSRTVSFELNFGTDDICLRGTHEGFDWLDLAFDIPVGSILDVFSVTLNGFTTTFRGGTGAWFSENGDLELVNSNLGTGEEHDIPEPPIALLFGLGVASFWAGLKRSNRKH